MNQTAKLIAASANPEGVVLVSLELRYWLAIHAELMTHRVFSRNAASNRAIPTKTLLDQVWNDPAGPLHWGVNEPGMKARTELVGWRRALAGSLWRTAAKVACGFAWALAKTGLHKQAANRVLMPFQYITVLVSSTEWENFFELRLHPDAQPEMRDLAEKMDLAIRSAEPMPLGAGEWHLPYVRESEIKHHGGRTDPTGILRKLSTARCARVSYLTHDKKKTVLSADVKLHDRLVGSVPRHASPAEHQAQAQENTWSCANFRGWIQYRTFLENPGWEGPK